jgi:predicted nucleic acid-binding protein
MSGKALRQGILDTNILVLRRWVDPGELPDEMAISAITLAELSAGPHQVRRNEDQDAYNEHAERARRLEVLQRAENEFDPVPFDARRGADLRPGSRRSHRRRPQTAGPGRRPDDRSYCHR